MPDYVNYDTVGSLLAQFSSRLTKLETFPMKGMAPLVTAPVTSWGGYLANSTTWADAAASHSPTFTIIRPTPILVLGTFECYNDVNTGHAVATWGRLYLAMQGVAPPGISYFGESMNSSPAGHTEGAPPSFASLFICFTPGPGTYYTGFQYSMSANYSGEPQVSATSAVSVFQLAG